MATLVVYAVVVLGIVGAVFGVLLYVGSRVFAVEVDPRVTTNEHLDVLHDIGFNRLSMGVQDFTPQVQEAVNRVQPADETLALKVIIRRLLAQRAS